MNPSNLPPQGRYSDDRLQQMVLDELGRQGVAPDKFYFTSDDWMITYDGPTPAWNSVFGIAPYRKDGQTWYAECGVSQRYDAAASQWGEPAATVKTGLPLSEEAFEAAPSSLGGSSADQRSASDSSQTVLADSLPAIPAAAGAGGGAAASSGGASGGFGGGADADEDASAVPSGEEWSAAERADGQPRVQPGPGHEWHHTEHEPEAPREQVPAWNEWSSADPTGGQDGEQSPAGDAGATADAGTTEYDEDLRQAGDLGVDESALADAPAGGAAGTAGAAAGTAGAVAAAAGATGTGGAAASDGSQQRDTPSYESAGAEATQQRETPSYESAGAEAEAREHPEGGHHAHVAGYALRVKADGTAELQVPLGGQVTLRWAGQDQH